MPAPAAAVRAARDAIDSRATALQASIPRETIERWLNGGDVSRDVFEAINRVYGASGPLTKALDAAMRAGFIEGHAAIGFPVQAGLTRDLSPAQAQAAAFGIERASEQWRILSSLVGQGVKPGYTLGDTASLIHDVLGLSPRWAQAVIRYRDGLVGEIPRWAANQNAKRYAARLLRARAKMIGTTQANIARNVGKEQTWRQAAAAGLLTRTAVRIWVVTEDERLCPRCMALDGAETTLVEPWQTETGPCMTPGSLHPHCRCEERIELR